MYKFSEEALIRALFNDQAKVVFFKDSFPEYVFTDPLCQHIYTKLVDEARNKKQVKLTDLEYSLPFDFQSEKREFLIEKCRFLTKKNSFDLVTFEELCHTIVLRLTEVHMKNYSEDIRDKFNFDRNHQPTPLSIDDAARKSLKRFTATVKQLDYFSSFIFSKKPNLYTSEGLDEIREALNENHCISTKLHNLDRTINGLRLGKLVTLGARTSMGKTSLALKIMNNLSKELHIKNCKKNSTTSVAYLSYEMHSEELQGRVLSFESKVPVHRIFSPDCTTCDMIEIENAQKVLCELPQHIKFLEDRTLDHLVAEIEDLQEKHNCKYFFVDHIHLLSLTGDISNYRVHEMSVISGRLKTLTLKNNITIVCLAQLSRPAKSNTASFAEEELRGPSMNDIRDSGSIEQDSDIVLMLHRPERFILKRRPKEDSSSFSKWQEEYSRSRGLAKLYVEKNRNGSCGEVNLFFNHETTDFTDLAGYDHTIF
ncbi:helicase [Abalone shriveling syndrome-associated virus]|uniref:helicase n=1 Tax=Abalone shriveling syndrome-associated virus TaxID=491893 RepID=UPI0001881BBD|nr:helicase [Abalone shriveling syndrome-associated virus]ACJ71998.1 helicase [Abalone shriveling syndrome-associated virus]